MNNDQEPSTKNQTMINFRKINDQNHSARGVFEIDHSIIVWCLVLGF